MEFFVGVIDGEGRRHVISGRAIPALRDMTTLTADSSMVDWGSEAKLPDVDRLARMLLYEVVDTVTPELVHKLVVLLIRDMDTGAPWLISRQELCTRLYEMVTVQ